MQNTELKTKFKLNLKLTLYMVSLLGVNQEST